jgi:hypothetical protein
MLIAIFAILLTLIIEKHFVNITPAINQHFQEDMTTV